MRRRAHDETGSVTLWMLLSVAAFILIVGVAVDLGGRLATLQRVNDVAAEAARTGAQQVTAADAMQGRTPAVDPARARTAALAYINAAGFSGSATVTSGSVLAVSVTGTYRPKFLGAAGVGPITLTGTAEARLVRAQFGTER